MMKIRFSALSLGVAAIACCLAFGTAASFAAPPPPKASPAKPAIPDDPAKVAAAIEFITLFHPKTDPRFITKQLDDAMPRMIEAAKRGNPKLDAKKFEQDKRTLILTNSGKILDRQAHVLSRHFTLQELQGLIAFCKSPLGHKLAVETGKIQEEMLMWNRKTREEERLKNAADDDDDDAPASKSKPAAPKGGPAPTKLLTPPAKTQK